MPYLEEGGLLYKLDNAKTYNYLNQDFSQLMEKMGIGRKWLN